MVTTGGREKEEKEGKNGRKEKGKSERKGRQDEGWPGGLARR